MTRLALDPARVAAEVAEYSRRMALAGQELATLDLRAEGGCARSEAFRIDRTVLWHYAPTAADAGLAPVVICYALVNRPTMLDLQPDRSLLRGTIAMTVGHGVILALGVAWLSTLVGLEKAVAVGLHPFWAATMLKTALGVAIMQAAWKLALKRRSRV